MSSLSNQLKTVKATHNALKIAPNQEQPSILFDKFTARNTSVDTIYSMALLAYEKLSSQLSNKLSQVQLRQELLSEQYKDINRNALTKQENRQLSEKLDKFMIEISPFLLNAECQQVLEYLLRNFKINTFQSEVLGLVYLQYWNYSIYKKVIGNIDKKQMTGKLSFLTQMNSEDQINFSFIIKTLTFSHSILDKLVSLVLESSLMEINSSKDESVSFGGQPSVQSQTLIKHPFKNFLMKIFLHLIKEKRTAHYKYIIHFCSSCLRIKSAGDGRDSELISMVQTLLANMIFAQAVTSEYLTTALQKLLKKAANCKKYQKSVFDFTMMVWQRKSESVSFDIIKNLESNTEFLTYFAKFQSSKYMVFHHLFKAACQGVACGRLIESIGVGIKAEQFYKLYEEQFLNSIFLMYVKAEDDKSSEISLIRNLIKKNFKFELGSWANQQIKSNSAVSFQYLKNIFESSQINQTDGSILIKKITKSLPQKKHLIHSKSKLSAHIHLSEMVEQKKRLIDSEDDSIYQIQQELPQSKSKSKPGSESKSKKLIQHLRKKNIHTSSQINFQDETTKEALAQLFYEHYDQKSQTKISTQQKNLILERLSLKIVYTSEMLTQDLEKEQYTTPIKYLLQREQEKSLQQTVDRDFIFGFLELIFSKIQSKKGVLQNIIFRELFRLTTNKLCLLAQSHYKQVNVFVSKYYKKFLSSCQSMTEKVQINAMMLKLSEKLFLSTGNNKGKYQNIVHSHCKMLSALICAYENHTYDKKQGPIVTEELLQTTYRAIIKIFGVKELYLINIGVIELISRKELNYKTLKYFIDELMVKQVSYEVNTNKESEIDINYYQHAVSVGRCLIFSACMFGVDNPEWVNSIEGVLTSGIAKNQISLFYGLIKEKLKKNIARKVFLFLKLTYQSKRFVAGFKAYLSTLQPDQLRKILHMYSQIYYVFLSISIQDAKIQNIIQGLLDHITNLFSLDLRLTLFEPLLPNPKLYGYLTEQLELHSQTNYNELTKLVNIVPDDINMHWIGFVKQCLKRGHLMTAKVLKSIFTNEHFLNSEANYPVFSQLICYLGEWDKNALMPYINQSMNMIMAICSNEASQDYCLALLYRVVTQLKQLVDPFVHEIFKYALQNQSQFVEKFIEDTVENLTIPTLIDTVKKLSKTCKHLYNFCIFFKNVCQKGVGHLLCKTLQYFFSKTIHSAVQDEQDLSMLYEKEAEIFLEMSLKFNENELRKVLIDFIRWSETKQNEESNVPFNMRKIIVTQIYAKLSQSLGHLFTPFYGYVFESYLKDLQTIASKDQTTTQLTGGKRLRPKASDFSDKTILLYGANILKSLHSLFNEDTQRQFMDGARFDLLSERLSNLYLCESLSDSSYQRLTQQSLSPCLLKLCTYIKDDYQLKTLNLKILLLLRHRVPRLQQAIFNFMDKLIDCIQDRYLLFVNDLVPFLIDNVQNRNEKVKIPIKSIINKIEQLSGTKIENYVK